MTSNFFSDPVHVEAALNEAIASLERESRRDIVETLRPILLSNLKKGRILTYTEGDPQKIIGYVNKVADVYSRLHDYLVKVQVDRDDSVWSELFDKLQKISKSFFIRKNFDAAQVNEEIAFGQATEAALVILSAKFPYDVEFDPWVVVIVQNCCLKYMRENMKKRVIPASEIETLDDTFAETVPDKKEDERSDEKELFSEVLAAMERLTASRKLVLKYRYLDGFTLEEVAQKIGKSKTEVYSLHFNAIKDIQKFLRP